jgi:uncharacterized membrane protein HdeD (DUF308 family)
MSAWTVVIAAGLVALGALAIAMAAMATLVSVLFVGWLLIVAGALEAGSGLGEPEWDGLLLHGVNGTLSVIAGVLVMLHAGLGPLFLTLVMTNLFVVGGLVRLVVSIAARLPRRRWIALSGLVGLALGLIMWSELPEADPWMIGTVVGIDLMVMGWTWLVLALASRRPGVPVPA